MKGDQKIVNKVEEAQQLQGQMKGTATASRKAEIMKMFSEVQTTQA